MYEKTRTINQKGFAAIAVSLTLVIILSLITVGFALLMRQEQNQVTNRQLANQAYYAAESGVNDAARALNEGYAKPKRNCGVETDNGNPGEKYLTDNNVEPNAPSPDAPTKWTCLLIDPAPLTLVYDSIDKVNPTILTMTGIKDTVDEDQAVDIGTITISWQDADDSVSTFRSGAGTAASAFPSALSWNSVGMLRAMLIPIDDFNRDALINNSFTSFLYPTSDSTNRSVAYGSNLGWQSQGAIMNGGCQNPAPAGKRYCSVTITGVNKSTMVMALRSIYSKTKVIISATDAAGAPIRIKDAQSLVDSTGKSQDILKRIQVRIPNRNSYITPGFAVESVGDVCKLLSVEPTHNDGTNASSRGC